MAHTLTEVASFDPTVTVPDGTDSRANAAEVVQGIAQALANRTQYLKPRADDAAQLSAANTFTQANTFSSTVTVTGTTTLNGAVTAADGTVNVTGGLQATGALTGGSLSVSGAATLSSATVNGTTTLNGNLTASDGTLEVASAIAATGAISTDGNLILDDITKDVVYSPSSLAIRYVNVPLSLGRQLTSNGSYDTAFDTWGLTLSGGPAKIRFPVCGVPRGAPAIGLEAVWRAHDVAAANVAAIIVNAQAAWGAAGGALVTPTDPVTLVTLNHTTGFSATQCTRSTLFIPEIHTVNNAGVAYFIDVQLFDGPNNRLFGLRFYYLDPGARNG